MEEATLAWCKYEQSFMVNEKHFEKQKFNLNCDDKGLFRSSTRINTKKLQLLQKQPVLVRSDSCFTKLLIWKCHGDVHHCRVENTLNKLRQSYWIIKGRQTVKNVLSKCIICKIVRDKTLLPPSTAKLLEYRLYFEYSFENLGLDYAGPLFTQDIFGKSIETFKSYILILTCAATRNTHLELVLSESLDLLLLAIRRFIARKGLPRAFISDNFKIFKSKEIKHLILSLNIKWKFILEKSPWWGGFYEQIIGMIKRIKKVVRKALLNYDELTTLLAEIE